MTLGIGKHNKNVRNVVKRRVSCCKLPGPSKTAIQIMLESDNFTTTILNQFNIDTNNTEVISNASLDDNITVDVTLKIDNITLADISSEDQTKLIDDTKNYIANTLGYNINNILVYLSEGSVNINIVVFAEVEDSVFTDVDDNEYRISVLGEITELTYNGLTQNGNTLTKDNIKTAVLGTNVTIIGDTTFNVCQGLTSIIIPNSVTSIGERAFGTCTSLTEFTIPSSVTSIGERAFWSCSSVTEFTIPDSVTTIGDSAFAYCYNVKQYIVSSNSNHFEAIDGVLYKKNSDNTLELIQYPIAKGNTAFTFPNNVVKLLSRSFASEQNLTSLVIPDSITSIDGNFTFFNMNIESIQLSNNLENIGGIGTFRSCDELTSITIPNSVKYIGEDSFYMCYNLTTVTFEENSQIVDINQWAFYDCGLTTVNIYGSSITISGNTYNAGAINIYNFFGKFNSVSIVQISS